MTRPIKREIIVNSFQTDFLIFSKKGGFL